MTVSLGHLLASHRWLLMEAAVVETMRRHPAIELHPTLAHAPLMYEEPGREILADLFRAFIALAREAGVPLVLGTPTWRANRDRVEAAGRWPRINREAVAFMQALRAEAGEFADKLPIGGLFGCRHDCYRPDESLPAEEAEHFHAWQIGELAAGGVDFLFATTLPALEEAKGIARAAAASGLPLLLSFVIDRQGRVLDGHSLAEVIEALDALTDPAPLGYMVNCSYPSFLEAATVPAAVRPRLLGLQANASALDHGDLENSPTLQGEPVEDWGARMVSLHRTLGLKMLGGCCGTGMEHLRYLLAELKTPA